MKISARNQLKGKVKKVTEGSINTEVIIELAPGVEIAAMITKTSAEDLGIKTGKEVYAIIKASNVMVGVDH
jgi:molybdopterin-binding protein